MKKSAFKHVQGNSVSQLIGEAGQLLQAVNNWNKQIDPTQADEGKVRRALESAKTLVETYTNIQRALAAPTTASASTLPTYIKVKGNVYKLAPPSKVTYRGRAYQRVASDDAVPISDEQPRDKGENAKVQNALKDSRKLYHEYKGKDPSLKETGINPDIGEGDYAGGLGGDGGAGVGDGGGGGNGGNGGG